MHTAPARYLLALFALLLTAPVAAERFPAAPHVYVTGEAVEKLAPDFVVVHFSVNRTGADVAATKQQVDAITERAWKAAQAVGIARKDFEATGFSVMPAYDFENGKRIYRGTQVSRQFTARLREMGKFNAFSEQLVQAGVQDVPGISVDVDQREAKEAALRITALQNARSEAEQLVAALGQTITGVHTISDTPIGDGGGVPFKAMRMEASAPDAPSLPDYVELRAEAYVVFLMMAK